MGLSLEVLKGEVNKVLSEWPKKKKFVEKVYKIFWFERLNDKKRELEKNISEFERMSVD